MEDKEIFDIIGLNIKVERTKRRLTQAKLAELINVHEKYVGKIETGKQNMTVKTLNKIANVLGVDITALFKPYEAL